MTVTWSDEKLILLYCPGRGSNSRPPARRSFKHDQGVLSPNHSATAADQFSVALEFADAHNLYSSICCMYWAFLHWFLY